MGNSSFVKHGFLAPTRWDVLRRIQDPENSWNINGNDWQEEGKKAQEEVLATWGPTDEEEQKRWQSNFDKWGPVPLDRTYTTYFDPQA